jgi:lipopolysaccharide heptosyltransferase II
VPAISSFFAARSMKVPFITTCHGYYATHLPSRVMGWGRFVIVSSNIVACHMIKDFGVPRERIRLIPRGVNLEKFSYREPDAGQKKGHNIGIIGRITPIKGHLYLIRAMSKVVRILPNINLFIIGDAPFSKPKYRQELETLVRRLSLSKFVHFLGQRHDIPQQLAKLDLVIMPSIGEETFGRVIIEAQAHGVCVIATRIGGIIDIIKDGKNGILVPPRDWNALSDAIIRLLKDPDLRSRLSKAARADVEQNFSLEHMYKKTISVYNEAIRSFNILVIKWSALGDIILSLPALKALRDKFPKARLILLTSNAGRELVSRYNYADEFIIFKQAKNSLEGMAGVFQISAELRRSCIDVALDLQNNKKSHMVSFLSCAPRRIGYKNKKLDFLLNEAIEGAQMAMSPVEHQFRLLKALDIDSAPTSCAMIISDEDETYTQTLLTEAWLSKREVLVGLNCGSSQKWQAKRWPTEKIAKLCDLLAQKKIRVIITGTDQEKCEAKRILALARSKPIDVTGKTNVMQLAAIIKRCKVFVSSDSAPLHIASLLNIPFVALFGPTDPARHLQPIGKYHLIYKRLKCSPCYRPKCKNIKCMDKITVEEVMVAINELLKEDNDKAEIAS